jgi:hypothetical protein
LRRRAAQEEKRIFLLKRIILLKMILLSKRISRSKEKEGGLGTPIRITRGAASSEAT